MTYKAQPIFLMTTSDKRGSTMRAIENSSERKKKKTKAKIEINYFEENQLSHKGFDRNKMSL